MDNSLFAYIQRLELMAFFSGYPLTYAIILVIAGSQQSKNNYRSRLISFMPFTYALLGTLYLGLLLKNLNAGHAGENIKLFMHQPYLKIWGLLSILFWIPALGKRPFLSLLHSFVFFFFFLKDLFFPLSGASENEHILRNDMKIYTDSFILNLIAFALIVLLSFLFARYKKYLKR